MTSSGRSLCVASRSVSVFFFSGYIFTVRFHYLLFLQFYFRHAKQSGRAELFHVTQLLLLGVPLFCGFKSVLIRYLKTRLDGWVH